MLAALSLATMVAVVAALLSMEQPNANSRFRYELEIYWQSWQRGMCDEESEEKGHAIWLYLKVPWSSNTHIPEIKLMLASPWAYREPIRIAWKKFNSIQTNAAESAFGWLAWMSCLPHTQFGDDTYREKRSKRKMIH